MAQRHLAAAFTLTALASAACSSPAWTSSSSENVTYISYDAVVTNQPVDGQCMQPQLVPQTDCSVSCVALVVYKDQTDQAAGCTEPGTSQPDPQTLARWATHYRELESLATTQPVPVACVYRQLVGGASSSVAQATSCANATPDYTGASCATSDQAGWCYAQGAAVTNGCPVGIQYGAGGPAPGTMIHLECLQSD